MFAPGSFQSAVKKPHHLTEASFETAVAMGCEICLQITDLRGETEYEWREAFPSEIYSFHLKITPPPNKPRIHSFSELRLETFSLQEVRSSRTALKLAERSLSRTHTGHNDVLNLAEYWFRDCLENHGACCNCISSSGPAWHPTRLLDISTELVKLFEPEVGVTDQPYATVSYCWGKEPFFRTTLSNLKQLQAGVSEKRFPRVFQDLMKVARHLRIQYLWIDCYCIIQSSEDAAWPEPDSPSDWQREAGNIESVYENSILNLGVAHATSPLQSCFQDREEHPRSAPIVEWKPRPSDEESMYLAVSPSKVEEEISELRQNPLFRRGWVFQERLLCRRMLHFAQDQIYWECSSHDSAESEDHTFKCESSPIRLGPGSRSPWRYGSLWSIDERLLKSRRADAWFLIVSTYSALYLTYPDKDKFFALNGIAKRAASLRDSDDAYVAGMFRKSLLLQLRWHTRNDLSRGVNCSRRSAAWRAPSWSWLSVDGEAMWSVSWFDNPIQLAHVADVSIELCDSSNPFGPLQSASLTLFCRALVRTIKEGKLKDDGSPESALVTLICDDPKEVEAVQGEIVIVPILVQSYWSEVQQLPSPVISRGDLLKLAHLLNSRQTVQRNEWTALALHKTEVDKYKRLGVVLIKESASDSGSRLLDSLIETEPRTLTLV